LRFSARKKLGESLPTRQYLGVVLLHLKSAAGNVTDIFIDFYREEDLAKSATRQSNLSMYLLTFPAALASRHDDGHHGKFFAFFQRLGAFLDKTIPGSWCPSCARSRPARHAPNVGAGGHE
jgi:hypothetical protein